MAKTDVALAAQQEPAADEDPLIGSFVMKGATAVTFEGGRPLSVEYPPSLDRPRYEVDPETGRITRPLP
jgi:hypothetical protein